MGEEPSSLKSESGSKERANRRIKREPLAGWQLRSGRIQKRFSVVRVPCANMDSACVSGVWLNHAPIFDRQIPMASPNFHLGPQDAQARIARLKGRPLFTTPKKISETGVKVHRCFWQVQGAQRPKYCSCSESVPYHEALAMIKRNVADWLLVENPRTKNLVPFERSIVVRPSREEIADQRATLKDRQTAEADLIESLRKLLTKYFAKGNLPPTVLNLSAAELRAALGNPESFQARFPEIASPALWNKVLELSADFWANHAEIENNPQSVEMRTGGYTTRKLDLIDGYNRDVALETGNLKEFSKPVRPSGHGPDDFESESEG
jgi:hypothetical protein